MYILADKPSKLSYQHWHQNSFIGVAAVSTDVKISINGNKWEKLLANTTAAETTTSERLFG